jgi:hypothetical protein
MRPMGTGEASRSDGSKIDGASARDGTFPGDGSGDAGPTRQVRYLDLAIILVLSAWVVASRIPYACDFAAMSKDGNLYVNSLALDRTYDVPPPGNIGIVLLAKAGRQVFSNALDAYEAVNVVLSVAAVTFCYLVATLMVPRPLAAASAFALTANTMVWWYGEVIASYLVWLAILPAVAWFGVRFARDRRKGDLLAATTALGIGMILRPDLLFFGTPLWFGCLCLGRAPLKGWLTGGLILAAACACWFFGTAAVLGGVETYLDRVHTKHLGDMAGYSLARRGLAEGLLRNGSKYLVFLAWGAPLALLAFLWAVPRELAALSRHWRGLLLALLWVGPSWYFSFFVFTGTAGLTFPFLPLLYIGAARGLNHLLGRAGAGRPTLAMAAIGLLSVGQFLLTPLLRETDQRSVILNVSLLRYSEQGLRARYNFDLDDYRVPPSLASVLRQFRDPHPIPAIPPRNAPNREALENCDHVPPSPTRVAAGDRG